MSSSKQHNWKSYLIAGIVVFLFAYLALSRIATLTRKLPKTSISTEIYSIASRSKWSLYGTALILVCISSRNRRISARDRKKAEQTKKNNNNFLHSLCSNSRHARGGLEKMQKVREYNEGACREAIRTFRSIERTCERSTEISRNNNRNYRPKGQNLDFVAVISDVVDRQSDIAADNGIKIEWSAPESEIMVKADLNSITSMVSDLVSNAVKYNKPNGSVRISVALNAASDLPITFIVSDTGIGMSQETMEQMFDEHYRADWHSSVGGTGQGLANVRSVVEPCGGMIDWLSELGKGSTFILYLPCDFTKRRRSRFAK